MKDEAVDRVGGRIRAAKSVMLSKKVCMVLLEVECQC